MGNNSGNVSIPFDLDQAETRFVTEHIFSPSTSRWLSSLHSDLQDAASREREVNGLRKPENPLLTGSPVDRESTFCKRESKDAAAENPDVVPRARGGEFDPDQ